MRLHHTVENIVVFEQTLLACEIGVVDPSTYCKWVGRARVGHQSLEHFELPLWTHPHTLIQHFLRDLFLSDIQEHSRTLY